MVGPRSTTTTKAVFDPLSGSSGTFDTPPREEPVPDRIGRYTIDGVLGRGGSGVVYAARDTKLDRGVAIKVVRPRRASHSEGGSSDGRRLVRESMALAALSHPNVIAVYDVVALGDEIAIAMEKVEGETLKSWMRRDHGVAEIVAMFRQAAAGLSAAHGAGLVHRDFKPSNAIVGNDGRLRVVDFGLAQPAGAHGSTTGGGTRSALTGVGRVESRLTATGVIMGTPAYMAPEQAEAGTVDARTDQFCFCVALFEALVGERPFASDSASGRLAAIRSAQLGPRARDLPGPLRRVLIRGLAYDPRARFASMSQLANALRLGSGRVWMAALGIVAVGLVAALPLQASPAPCRDVDAAVSTVWDAAARDRLRTSLESRGALSGPLWGRVADGLDGYAAAWSGARRQACLAAQSSPDDAREAGSIACLSRRLAELDAVIRLVDRGDASVLPNVALTVHHLPPPADCLVDDGLEPVPSDIDDEVRAIRDGLAGVLALELAGQAPEALHRLELLEPRAEALGYAPLWVEMQAQRGRLHYDAGDYAEAERALTTAYFDAVAVGDHAVAARSAGTLISVVGDWLGRPEDGQTWIQHARASSTRAGQPIAVEAVILRAEAILLIRQGRRREAAARLQDAVAAFGDEADSLEAAQAQSALAIVRQELGDVDVALRLQQDALSVIERELGPTHPEVGAAVNSLANIFEVRGQSEQALQTYQRAVEVWTALSNEANLAMAHYNIGRLHHVHERADLAVEHYDACIRLLDDAVGPNDMRVAMPVHNLGSLYIEQRRWPEAKAAIERALKIFVEAKADPLYVAHARYNLARIHEATGAPARARELARLARDGFAEAGPMAASDLARAQAWLDGEAPQL